MKLPEKLERHILHHQLLGKEHTYLLALSGGLDSTVLAECLHRLGFQLEIAHVNFGLRGQESDREEETARNWAAARNRPFHLLRAAGSDWQKAGLSLQENARNLRYNWFRQLLKEKNLSAILTAHQADDQIETLIQRFFRGAGPKGLSGIQARTEDCIRPLLPFSRSEIEAFARQEQLSWSEDSSNTRTDYQRNQIRHQLIPLLETQFPGLSSTLLRNAERMQQAEAFLKAQALPFLENTPAKSRLSRKELLEKNAFYLLSCHLEECGFSWETAQEICHLPESNESRAWKCGPVLVERKGSGIWIWSGPDSRKEPESWHHPEESLPASWAEWEISLNLTHFRPDPCSFPIPAEGIAFPMSLRRPASGDKFRPFGMKGRRDLSDVLSEAGLSPEERRRWPLLCDAQGTILWIPGIRSALDGNRHPSEAHLHFSGRVS